MLSILMKQLKCIYNCNNNNNNRKNKNNENSNQQLKPFLTVEEAHELFLNKKVKFIDCRDPNEYNKEHIKEAKNVNEIFSFLGNSDEDGVNLLMNLFEDAFQRAGINSDDHLIMYENSLNSRFGSSCRGYFILKTLGHNKVQVLDGGYDKWQMNGYEIENEYPGKVKRGDFKAKWDRSLWAGKEDVAKALEDKTILVDVREDEEFNGSTSSPYGVDFVPRKGRLPGAIHINWKALFAKDQQGCITMKTPQQIRQTLTLNGINDLNAPIILYCFKGARASNSLIAFQQAGFTNVKNYFASWNEWSKHFSLPIQN